MVKVKNPEEIKELVTSGPYEKKRIFSIVAHIDHGKTTTTDYLLRRAGLMREEDAGLLLSTDSDDEEQERGITIFTSVVLLSFDDPRKPDDDIPYIYQINDTPGHISFTGEVSRALRGSDGCIILVDALEGVMTQTETNIRLSVGEELCKPVLFINKVDRLINELKLSPKQVYERIDAIQNEVNALIKKIAPPGIDWRVSFADNSVAIGSAKHGWGFTYEILKEHDIAPTFVFEKYNEGDIAYLRKNLRLDESLMRMVVDHLPDPITAAKYRIPKIWSEGDLESDLGKTLLNSDPKGSLYGMITKIFIDPKSFRATLIGRVFSGTLDSATPIYLLGRKEKVRIKRLGVMEITDILPTGKIPAGNLFALEGFICPTGETFIDANMAPATGEHFPVFEQIKYACEPVVSRSIKPKDFQDLAKLGEVVQKWLMADTTAEFRLDDESKEYILSGIDPLQIDILTKRIDRQVPIDVGEPIIVYREKIEKITPEVHTKSMNTHNKFLMHIEPLNAKSLNLLQSGKVGEYMDVKERAVLFREEAGWDTKEARRIVDIYKGNILVNGTKGLQRFDRVKNYLVAAFRDWTQASVLAKEPALGLKIVFTDMVIHEDPRHTQYNQIAGMVFSGFSLAFLDGEPQLYEPIQRVDIKTPQGTESSIISILTQHRGKVVNVSSEGEFVIVHGELPAAETLGIDDEFRGATQGRAFFGYEFKAFEKVPKKMQEELIAAIRKRKGMKGDKPDMSAWERFRYKKT
jgi:elongation factor 2